MPWVIWVGLCNHKGPEEGKEEGSKVRLWEGAARVKAGVRARESRWPLKARKGKEMLFLEPLET